MIDFAPTHQLGASTSQYEWTNCVILNRIAELCRLKHDAFIPATSMSQVVECYTAHSWSSSASLVTPIVEAHFFKSAL
jgi:hypothetical protein